MESDDTRDYRWSDYFSFHDTRQASFAARYNRLLEQTTPPSARERIHDCCSVYLYEAERCHWKVLYVRPREHDAIVDSILRDKTWRHSIHTEHQIPAAIFRACRTHCRELFPQLYVIDEEHQPPFYLEDTMNSRRYVNYLRTYSAPACHEMGVNESIRQHVAGLPGADWDDTDAVSNATSSTAQSEFTNVAQTRKLLFLCDESSIELRFAHRVVRLDCCPYALSATLFVLAQRLETDEQTLQQLYFLLSGCLERESTRAEIQGSYLALVVRRLISVLLALAGLTPESEVEGEPEEEEDPTLPTTREIRNLLTFFADVRVILERSVFFKDISFAIVPVKRRDSHQLVISRAHASPTEVYAGIIILCAKYLPGAELLVGFDSDETVISMDTSTMRRMHQCVIPHMIATRKFINPIRSKTILYPLLTWNYLYGDDESVLFTMRILLCYIVDMHYYANPIMLSFQPCYRLFHRIIARLMPHLDSMFTAPFLNFDELKFGLTQRARVKRLRSSTAKTMPSLGSDESDTLYGFHYFAKNIYTALDAYLRMSENRLVLSAVGFRALVTALLNHKEVNSLAVNFPLVWEWINDHETVTRVCVSSSDEYVPIGSVELADQLYHLCATSALDDKTFQYVFMGVRHLYWARRWQVTDFRPTQVDMQGVSDTHKRIELQPQLQRRDWDTEYAPERTAMNLERESVEQTFAFFRYIEHIAKYPFRQFTVNQVRQHVRVEEYNTLFESKSALPYRGNVQSIEDFEQETYDASMCIDADRAPNVTVHRDSKTGKLTGLLDSFVKLCIGDTLRKVTDCVRYAHSEELPPVADFHPDFIPTILTNPCIKVTL